MKTQLNKDLIEEINVSSNDSFFQNANNFIINVVSNAVNDISFKSPFIKLEKCVLQAVNEDYLGVFTQLSEYSYFLGVENPQIELNSVNRKNIWKIMWREFKANWRIGKKKYKKEKNPSLQPVEKYKLSDFKHDLVKYLSQYLSQSSLIYEFPNHISMLGKDDFGANIKVNIYICSYNSKTKVYKLFSENKNKFFDVNFGARFENINSKVETLGSDFADIIRLFNALYSKNYNKIPNQILIESLIFNCPKILFVENDIYKTFLNISNYIRISDPIKFCSICDPSKNIFDEPLIIKANSQVDYSKLISMLDKFKI